MQIRIRNYINPVMPHCRCARRGEVEKEKGPVDLFPTEPTEGDFRSPRTNPRADALPAPRLQSPLGLIERETSQNVRWTFALRRPERSGDLEPSRSWIRSGKHKKGHPSGCPLLCFLRARDGTRTRDPDLGKVVLHQLSHSRMMCFCQAQVIVY